jgi:cytochrome c biogenesis protein CcmG, thiol:disulfide interchange protein DsbE
MRGAGMRAAAATLALLLCLAAGAVPCRAADAGAPSAGAYILSTGKMRRGDLVPRFQAVDIYGAEIDLEGLLRSGKRPLLAFWSMYCKSCVEKFDSMILLQSRYASQGLAVVSINTDGEYRRGPKVVRDFIADYERRSGRKVNFPILYDERNWVAQAMSIEFLPTIVTVDEVGRIGSFYQSFGEHSEGEILAGLEGIVRQALRLPVGEAAAGGVASSGFGAGSPDLGGLRVGDAVPPIRAQGIFGTVVNLEEMLARREKVLLVFWSMYCQSCIEKLKAIVTVQERYGPQGLKVVSVNTDGEYGHGAETVRRFVRDFEAAKKTKLNFPVLYDDQNPLPNALHIEFLPTIVSVDPSGRVLNIYQKFDESCEEAILAGVDGIVREMLERFAKNPPGQPRSPIPPDPFGVPASSP